MSDTTLAGGASWLQARAPKQLRDQVHENLTNLGQDVLDVVNLRVGGAADGHTPEPGSIAEQIREAQGTAPVVTVQNHYNLAHRDDVSA